MSMRHKYLILVLSFFLCALLPLSAQKNSDKKQFDIEKFKKEKAQFLTKEMELNDTEVKTFIPLVNELMDKKFELSKSARKENRAIRSKQDKTETDYEKMVESSFEQRTKELQLDKEYHAKFKKILSAEKIYKYYKAETKFMRNMVGNNKNKSSSAKK